MSQSSANIVNKGANRMYLAFLTAVYTPVSTALASGTNAIDLGHIGQSSTTTDISKEEFKSEDGIVRGTDVTRTIKTEATLMESHKTLLDFLAFTVAGKTCYQYRFVRTVNGQWQEMHAIVQPDAQINSTSPGGVTSNKYNATHIAPETAVTFTSGDLSNIESGAGSGDIKATTVTIAANQEFALTNTAVA